MPPLTLENAGALVPGGVSAADIEKERRIMQQPKPAQPAALKVRVLRSFYYQGKPIEKGAEVTLPRAFALEMKAASKLQILEEPAAPAPKDAGSAAATSGSQKGDRNAR
jgi:hypothetical protein